MARVRKGRDITDINRAQGELDVLDRIIGLPEEIKGYNQRTLEADLRKNKTANEVKQGG